MVLLVESASASTRGLPCQRPERLTPTPISPSQPLTLVTTSSCFTNLCFFFAFLLVLETGSFLLSSCTLLSFSVQGIDESCSCSDEPVVALLRLLSAAPMPT